MHVVRYLIACALFAALAHVSAAEPWHAKPPLGLPALRALTENPLTEAKVKLGQQLFFDARLSRDNTVSCASCHDPAKGWSNGEAFATGVRGQKGGRSAPTILNSGYQQFQFWDGRAHELEGQAVGPIQNPIEMDLTLPELVAKLNQIAGYKSQFQAVFKTDATETGIAQAIAAFERTVMSGNAPYDRFKAGDKTALSEAAERGRQVFFNAAHCSACHAGPNFTDGAFHNLGVGIKQPNPDLGRFEQTKVEGDRGSFKTPTLREIARTSPYMHNGSLATLEDVVEYYDRGGEPTPQLDEELYPLKLSAQQKADLIVFLKEGLAGNDYPLVKSPPLPE